MPGGSSLFGTIAKPLLEKCRIAIIHPKRLSAFAEALTSREQGWLIGGSEHALALRMPVNDVRTLREECDNPEIDVVWHYIVCTLPGADGNAGIAGLGFGNKAARRYL